MGFVFIPQPHKNLHSFFRCRLPYQNRLEPTFQCCVLFDMLTVFINCGCSDQLHCTTRQRRFNDVRCVNSAFRSASADNGVNFIHKEDDAGILCNFLHNAFHALFKFATILCACYHGGNIQRYNDFVPQVFWYGAVCDPLCQAFHHGGFTHAGFPDQAGIVFGSSGENLNHPFCFSISADDRVYAPFLCQLAQVCAEFG